MDEHYRATLVLAIALGTLAGCSEEPLPPPATGNPFAGPQGGVGAIPIAPKLQHHKPQESKPRQEPAVAVASMPAGKPQPKSNRPVPGNPDPRAIKPKGTNPGRSPRDPARAQGRDAPPLLTQKESLAQVEKLGGKVKFDEKSPDRPPVSIDFSGTQLDNAGLRNVSGLSSVKSLNLKHTNITGAGLASLQALTNLKTLNLGGTRIGNSDLRYLQNMKSLETLVLYGTRVNAAGIKALKSALPNLKISH